MAPDGEALAIHASGRSVAAAGGGGMVLGDCDLVEAGAEIFVRIDRHHVNADLVVEVGAGGAARLTHIADDLSAGYVLPGNDDHGGEMAVDGDYIAAVVDGDFAAVARAHTRTRHIAVGCGTPRRALGRGDTTSGMESAFPVEG